MNKKQQRQELQQINIKLEKGLNGVYYKEFRRASLLTAYDAINELISNNKKCVLEWYPLKQATRDTLISFNNRSYLTAAIKDIEEALHERGRI